MTSWYKSSFNLPRGDTKKEDKNLNLYFLEKEKKKREKEKKKKRRKAVIVLRTSKSSSFIQSETKNVRIPGKY